MARLAGKRRLIIAAALGLLILGGLLLPLKSTKAEQESSYALLVRVYNALNKIIAYLNSRAQDMADVKNQLGQIVANQQAIQKELKIIKMRATRR